MTSSDPILSHLSINPSGCTTILFIHGALSSQNEWRQVASQLTKTSTNYHLLIPSLPSHGSNISITPFSLALSTRLLGNLIRSHAMHATAHVVGLSLGAHVALDLAARHSDLILSVFASGFSIFKPSFWSPILPVTVYGVHLLESMVPKRVRRYLMDGADVEGADEYSGQTPTLALTKEIIAVIVSDRNIPPVKARMLVVAATKGGLIPSNDSVEVARMVTEKVRDGEGSKESKVVEARGMRHPWNLQDPQLFAWCVVAWVEGRQLPEQLLDL